MPTHDKPTTENESSDRVKNERKRSRRADVRKKKKKTRRKPEVLPDLVCPPDRDGKSGAVNILGIALRAFVLAMLALSTLLLIATSFKIEINTFAAFLACLLFTSLFSVTVTVRKWGVPIGTVASIGVIAYGFFATPVLEGLITFYNAMLDRMISAQYYGMANWKIDIGASAYPTQMLIDTAVITLCFLLCAFITLLLGKRISVARMIPVCTVIAVIVTVLLTYNIVRDNWSIALFLASACATIVLASFDRIFAKRSAAQTIEAHALLYESDEPKMPEELLARASERERLRDEKRRTANERRSERSAERRKRKRIRKGQASADEEISEYFRPKKRASHPLVGDAESASSKRKKRAEAMRRMTDEERKAFLADERRKRKQARDHERGLRRSADRVSAYHAANDRARIASSGFAGFCALVVMLALLLVPTLTVTGRFTTFPSLEKHLEQMREYVTALLRGDDPILDLMDFQNNSDYFEPHDTTAVPLRFTGKRLMSIGTQYDTGVYLRGWIGVDYADGAWHAVDDETRDEYRKLFGYQSSPSEQMLENFYSLMKPEILNRLDYAEQYATYKDHGLVTLQVNISRDELGQMYTYFPYAFVPELGLRGFGSDEGIEASFVNFFDGMYVGRAFENALDYAIVAHMTNHKDPEWIENVAPLIEEFYAAKALVEQYNKDPEGTVSGNTTSVYDPVTGCTTVTFNTPSGQRVTIVYDSDGKIISTSQDEAEGELDLFTLYRDFMTDAQRREVMNAFRESDAYRNFVYDTYLKGAQSSVITGVLNTIFADTALDTALASGNESFSGKTYVERHKVTMQIIDWLCENYEYTITPKQNYDASLDGVENFLSVQKEGYCVQFASAAALMLRELGIPVRYVEGYLCSDLKYYPSYTGSQFSYKGTVKDDSAHAWIEVWYDGIGWVSYECTPEYYSEMYYTSSTTTPDQSDKPGYTPPNREPFESEREAIESIEQLLEYYESTVAMLEAEAYSYPEFLAKEEIVIVETLRYKLDAYISRYNALRSMVDDLVNGVTSPNDFNATEYYADITNLDRDIQSLDSIIDPLYVRLADIAQFISTFKTVLVCIACVLAVVSACITVLVLASRARKRMVARVKSIADGEFSDGERRVTACELIDLTNFLLKLYGSAPATGELRDEYAKRLSLEYETVFGHATEYDSPNASGSDVDTSEGKDGRRRKARRKKDNAKNSVKGDALANSSIRIGDILDSIAAEEFGGQMSREQIKALADFCLTLIGASSTRLSIGKWLLYHCVLHKI